MKVAVAGGTGVAGSSAVAALRERGDEVVVLSRSHEVDLVSGDGLAEAVVGVEAVIDATSIVTQDRTEAVDFFTAVARNLQRAGAAAGVKRIVTLSIVGIDASPARAHYAGKLAQEATTRAGDVPAVILRATQFHDFAGQYLGWMRKGPVVPTPIQPTQTVDVVVVGEQLARLAHAEPGVVGWPVDGTIELAGPQPGTLAAQVRAVARQRGDRVLVLPLWLPGSSEKAIRRGAARPGPAAIIEGSTFDEWLARIG